MIEWFVAKYMPDLRRREPRNVGVILSVDGRLMARFYGERPDGELDGRKSRFVSSGENYRDWVHYWRTLQTADALPLVRRATDNYYLERGGRILIGAEEHPETLLQRLYEQMVPPSDSHEHIERELDPVAELFASVGAAVAIESEPVIEIELDAYPFDYGIRTPDRLLLFRRVVFNGKASKTWDSVHAAAEAVSQVAAHRSDQYAPYVIGFEKEPGDSVKKQALALRRRIPDRFRQSEGLASDRDWLQSLGAPILVAHTQ